MITAIATTTLGENKSAPRIWFDGMKLVRSGFDISDHFNIVPNLLERTLKIVKKAEGLRTVSRKKRSYGDMPVIDINNKSLADIFGKNKLLKVVFAIGAITVSLHPTVVAQEVRLARLQNKLTTGAPLSIGSLPHGAGIMDLAIKDGLAKAGLKSSMAFALDMQSSFLDVSMKNNPVWSADTVAIETRVEDLDLNDIPVVDVLVAGVPCPGASLSGKAKNKNKFAELHPTAGTFFHHFINVCRKAQSSVVVLENVVPYANTAGYHVLRTSLERMGYSIHESQVRGEDHGAFETRKRFVMIAVTDGLFYSGHIESTPVRPATLGTILDPDVPEEAYRNLSYLDRKAEKDAAAGKGFKLQRVTADSTKVGTLGAGYHKWRSTEAHVAHPTKPGFARLLTPKEHARVKTIPAVVVKDVAPTLAHELLGQSVIFNAFVAVGKAIGLALTTDASEQAGQGLPLFDQSITA